MIFESPTPSSKLVIPDDITVAQFIFGEHPNRPARLGTVPWLVEDVSGLKYGKEELQFRSKELFTGMQRHLSLKPDDVVVIFSPNHIDYAICIWAVHHCLGIVAGTNPAFTIPELTSHLRKIKASAIIAHSDVLPVVKAATAQAGLGLDRIVLIDRRDDTGELLSLPQLIQEGKTLDPLPEPRLKAGEGRKRIAFLNTSSGTTGPPKVVKISHFCAIANVLQAGAHNRIHENYTEWEERRYRVGDACLAVLPLYHIYGLVVILHFNLFAGMSVVVVPKFDFVNMLSSITRHRITHLMAVPPQVVLLTKHEAVKNFDLSGIRVVLCAASALPRELYDQLRQLLPQAHIGQAYGSTEVTGIASMHPINEKQSPTCGVFVPGVRGKVVKADGSLGRVNEEGELWMQTIALTSGYLDDENATKETYLEDGWVRSGDIVKINEKGNIVIVDRSKEILKVRGFQVAPAELEGTILDSPLVDDACVVPLPDAYSGELPLAFVVLSKVGMEMIQQRGEKGEREIKEGIMKHVAANKARFKHLARVEFIDAIPKTPSGKMLRRDLRDKARRMVVVGSDDRSKL